MILSGKLIYDDNGNYQIQGINLSSILEQIYYNQNTNHISVRITKGCKVIFSEEGNLYRKRDQFGLYSYYINGNEFENVLFNNCGEDVEIVLFSEALEGTAYGKRKKAS